MVNRLCLRAACNAPMTLALLPEVEMPTNTSPGRYSNDEKQEFDGNVSEGFLKLLGHTRASFREAYGNRFDNLVHPGVPANACSTPSTARSSTAITIRWSTA